MVYLQKNTFKGSSAVDAATKNFVFNETVASAQFSNSNVIIEKSVETGVSSNLETTISLIEDPHERSKTFGNGYFVSNGGFVSAPVFTIEIGVNNPTSVSVVYGLIHDTATTATEVQCGM